MTRTPQSAKSAERRGRKKNERKRLRTRPITKHNRCTSMPPHQLHRATHSCHLDRFLLPPASPSSLSSVQKAASRPADCDRRGGDRVLTGPAAASAEELPAQRWRLWIASAFGACWTAGPQHLRRARTVAAPSVQADLLYPSRCCCCCCSTQTLEKGRETKHTSLPLDCIEIKVTVWRCPQKNDITLQRAAYSSAICSKYACIPPRFEACSELYSALARVSDLLSPTLSHV